MELDYDRLRKDIIRSGYKDMKSQKEICDEIGINRTTLWRFSNQKPTTVETLLKILKHLNKPLEYYIQ